MPKGSKNGRTKVEAVLSPDQMRRFKVLRIMSGSSSDAEYVRQSVLSESVGEWREVSERMGALHDVLNKIAASIDTMPPHQTISADDLASLVEQGRVMIATLARMTPERRSRACHGPM
jgi:hypothetical protein